MSSKTCQERVGLFKEMGYLHTGGWGITNQSSAFNDQANKGLQMLPGGSKEVSAGQDGFFTKEFSRVFDGESWASAYTTDRLMDRRVKGRGKVVGDRDWYPSDGSKEPNGLGTYFGTFIKEMPAFDPNLRGRGPVVHEEPNVKTNPSKKGTGYGYAGVAINPYPEHSNDTYAEQGKLEIKYRAQRQKLAIAGPLRLNNYPITYFGPDSYYTVTPERTYNVRNIPANPTPAFRIAGPAKKDGGNKAGCFNKFPEYMPDLYSNRIRHPQNVMNKDNKICYPPMRAKTLRQPSMVNTNIARSIHEQSWRTKRNVVYNEVCTAAGL